MRAATLSEKDKLRLRRADAAREVAVSGCMAPEAARNAVVAYLELLEEFHEVYELDEDTIYEFDSARGFVFECD